MNDLKIGKFIEDLSSDLPAPGGGAVAALVAALAGGLTSMVYSLTKGKKVFEALSEEDKEKMEKCINEIREFTKNALVYGKRDEEAFNELMECYKLPKNTEEEIEVRKNKISMCTEKCMSVPFELAEKSLEVFENIKFATEKGNKNLITDAMIGAILLDSAIEASIINVKINLASIKNEELKLNTENRIKEIEKQSKYMKDEILAYAYKQF